MVACPCACKKNNKYKVKITLEADIIKQAFLQLYAKLKGHSNEIKQPDADESRPRDFEKHMLCCVSMCFKKEKYKVKNTLEAEFIKQPFLQLYAKLKGSTHEI